MDFCWKKHDQMKKSFYGNNERKRYEDGKDNSIAMYFDIQNVIWKTE